jgi:hypothetical protein
LDGFRLCSGYYGSGTSAGDGAVEPSGVRNINTLQWL